MQCCQKGDGHPGIAFATTLSAGRGGCICRLQMGAVHRLTIVKTKQRGRREARYAKAHVPQQHCSQ